MTIDSAAEISNVNILFSINIKWGGDDATLFLNVSKPQVHAA
jgi:hypothetical protein